MAGNRNSLARCLTSLENTLKSTSTGRPKLIKYIETTSGSQRDEHVLILGCLEECLLVLSDETSDDDKIAKARGLAREGGSVPPRVILTQDLLATLRDSDVVTELETAARKVFNLNAAEEGSTLGAVFKAFAADERAKEASMCGAIAKTKKTRTCEAL